jgi:hypothetical protein
MMFLRTAVTLLVGLLGLGSLALAHGTDHGPIEEPFRFFAEVNPPALVVPRVVEVPLPRYDRERPDVVVMDHSTGSGVPSYLIERYSENPLIFTPSFTATAGFPNDLIDRNFLTGVYFDVPLDRTGVAEITLTAPTPTQVSGFTFNLERNVSLPLSVSVRTRLPSGEERVLLAPVRPQGERVSFVPTVGSVFIVRFEHIQPLKINELTLLQDAPETSVYRAVRFLAQPGVPYLLYLSPDRMIERDFGEMPNLRDDRDVVRVEAGPLTVNDSYQPFDYDLDGVADNQDNCLTMPNSDQLDTDGNGRGDVCDDWDKDVIPNRDDNCPTQPNLDQIDTDRDGMGDACDREESRVTEKHAWLPWVGLGTAALVLAVLFAIVTRRTPPTPPTTPETPGAGS